MSQNLEFKKLIDYTLIVVPAYNAIRTIDSTLQDIMSTGFYNILVSDDNSEDNIEEIINKFNVKYIKQNKNLGYGGNQKFLYNYAIRHNYKYIIMIHGDNQYTPKLIPSLITMLHYAGYDFVIGSRILGGNAIKNGMPVIKYIANRGLTLFQNVGTGYKLSEYHTGLRGYKLQTLQKVNFYQFSDSFLFDNQMILEIIKQKLAIGEVSCITKYDVDSSSISYYQSAIYAIGVIKLTFRFIIQRVLN